MAAVYVISASGKPLMPTTRCGHIRGLLNAGKARVVEREPFTIQLKYETPDVTQPLYLGIDPGRTNVGSAVVREDGECVFTAQLTTRNKDVPKLMKARKQFRMAHRRLKRRCKRQRRPPRLSLRKESSSACFQVTRNPSSARASAIRRRGSTTASVPPVG